MRGIGRLLTLAAVLVLVVGLGMMLSSTQESPVSPGAPTGSTAASAPAVDGSGLEAVAASSLPREARETRVEVAVSSVYSLGGQNAALVFKRL